MRLTGNLYMTVPRFDGAEMSVNACAALLKKADPDRFLSVMAAPPAARAVLFPIYAFNVEVARAPWVTEESMIAEMRLQWWRDALEEIGSVGSVRRHEVVTPLAEVISPVDVPVLDKLVSARRWDIYKDPFEDETHFRDYLTATSGGLLQVAGRALGAEGHDPALARFGYAIGLANWFIAVPELEARGRIPFVDGREQAVVDLAQEGLQILRETRKQVPPAARAATRSGWLADRTLRSAAANPAIVKDGRLHISDFVKKASLISRVLTGSP